MINLLTEQYILHEANQPYISLARQFYYKLKPFLPMFVQLFIRHEAIEGMRKREFPAWEIDTSVDFLHRNVITKLLETR